MRRGQLCPLHRQTEENLDLGGQHPVSISLKADLATENDPTGERQLSKGNNGKKPDPQVNMFLKKYKLSIIERSLKKLEKRIRRIGIY